jgi:hypothetical protein
MVRRRGSVSPSRAGVWLDASLEADDWGSMLCMEGECDRCLPD